MCVTLVSRSSALAGFPLPAAGTRPGVASRHPAQHRWLQFYFPLVISNLILTTTKLVCITSELCEKQTVWSLYSQEIHPLALPTQAIMLHNLYNTGSWITSHTTWRLRLLNAIVSGVGCLWLNYSSNVRVNFSL